MLERGDDSPVKTEVHIMMSLFRNEVNNAWMKMYDRYDII